jgi:hypothetical protein
MNATITFQNNFSIDDLKRQSVKKKNQVHFDINEKIESLVFSWFLLCSKTFKSPFKSF